MILQITKLPIWAHIAATLAIYAAFDAIRIRLEAEYKATGYPVDFATGQLSFSAQDLESHYAVMQQTGGLDLYWHSQMVDFAFLVSFALLALFLGTLAARVNSAPGFGHALGIWAARLGIFGAGCDACENLISFALLANPAEVSQPLALIYSSFAAIKFAALGAAIVAVVLSALIAATARLRSAFGEAR